MAVQYDRAMITLIREIRNHLKGDDKLGVKLANPELLTEIADIYQRPDLGVILKALIHELFNHAGDEWREQLQKNQIEKRYVTKSYRGVQQLIEAPKATGQKKESTRQRIYRGQVVNS